MGAKGKRKSQQDLTQAISELNKSFSLITDLVQLRDNFVARIKEITATRYVTVFLMDHDFGRYYPIGKEVNNVPELEGVFFQPGPGRAGRHLPAPPQIRTNGFSVSGSSVVSFAMKEHKNEQ